MSTISATMATTASATMTTVDAAYDHVRFLSHGLLTKTEASGTARAHACVGFPQRLTTPSFRT